MRKFKFIDLFCGIGGFHQAMSELGGECVFASDIDKDCRKTYKDNYGIVPIGDITKVDENEIPEFDVLCAGFPCQSFSKAGNRLGFSDPTKGTLFFDIVRIMKHHKPKFTLLENVRNLASHDGGNTWRTIYETLNGIGYNVPAEPVIFSPHYIGIPQHRERVFIMCVRKDVGDVVDFNWDGSNVECSIDSVLQDDSEIDNIERYKLTDEQISWIDNWNIFIKRLKCEKLPGFPVWTECFCNEEDDLLYRDLNQLPKWKQNFVLKNRRLYSENKEFIDEWLIEAKKNKLFFGSKAKFEWQAGDSGHDIWKTIMQIRPSGLRVKPGNYFPALVAMTQTSIVGKRKRFLTPRECARLQSFPDSFKYDEKEQQSYKQFGNSVNCAVVKMFAEHMFKSCGY